MAERKSVLPETDTYSIVYMLGIVTNRTTSGWYH
jgi:hypothetical protein